MTKDRLRKQSVEREIISIHQFLQQWINGVLPKTQAPFDAGFKARLDPDFVLIPPAGTLLDCGQLLAGIYSAHGTNPDFRIKIRNVTLYSHDLGEDAVLASYEEYQKNAVNSKPPDNARISTALLKRANPPLEFTWAHIHETRLPPEKHAPELFDF